MYKRFCSLFLCFLPSITLCLSLDLSISRSLDLFQFFDVYDGDDDDNDDDDDHNSTDGVIIKASRAI